VIVTFEASELASSFVRPIGVSGVVMIVPPEPTSETSDSPLMLTAVTRANIVDPHSRLYGAPFNDEIGTVHYNAAKTVESAASHEISVLNLLSSL